MFEAVITSVDYSDFLCWTLPNSRAQFDRLVVVTAPHDTQTTRLCEYWHVECVTTEAFGCPGAFNKGAGINEGLKKLHGGGWVVHLDADVFLPPTFRNVAGRLPLDPECIYGIDRLNCSSFDDWLSHWYNPRLVSEAETYVHLDSFTPATRIALGGTEWVPLGYFQMWHQGKRRLSYPTEHTDAGRTDLQFARHFPPQKRVLLPQLVAVHLETKLPGGAMGVNWRGRRTPPFAPANSPLFPSSPGVYPVATFVDVKE